MSIPLPDQTYYRMADQIPAASTITGLLNAIYTALTATVDYRGTSLASTHLWTWARYQNAGTTEAVYNTAIPSGSPMTLAPTIMFAGTVGASSPTMLSPDSFTASNLLTAVVKNSGAYNAWTNANPMTSGQHSGFWRALGTTWNSTGATTRVFIGQESVFVQCFTTSTGQTNGWIYIGAIGEPLSTAAGAGESDNRIYGMAVSGATTTVDVAWLSTASSMFAYVTAAGWMHMGVFQPGAATIYPCGRRTQWGVAASIAETVDPGGAYCGDLMRLHRATGSAVHDGARLGLIRSVLMAGALQGGRVLRNGSTDLYHVIGVDNTAADDSFLLKAAP